MSNYISSNNNRFYVGIEASYGVAAAAEQLVRIPAVSLKTKHERERLQRRDKTGTRTFLGLPSNVRFQTSFELNTYMTGWVDPSRPPSHTALFQAVLGGSARTFNGGVIAGSSGTQVTFASPHQLGMGQAIGYGGEIRFVVGVVDGSSVQVNAPFSASLPGGTAVRGSYTYSPGPELKSATVMDCWSPDTAVSRMLPGVAVDRLQMDVNGDFHEFRFSGSAADVLDNATFINGQGGLQQFPAEPASSGFDYTIIPGHLGQAWIGSIPNQFFTLASARITLQNNVVLRAREFGYLLPRAIAAGERDVRIDFSIFAQDDAQTKALYQAARQQSAMSVMIQLGQQDGQLCGVFMKSVIAEVPEYDDAETRLIWHFRNCRAQGIGDDEIFIALA
jgi:hypothetical protein